MKKIIILIAILCTFVSAECEIDSSEKHVVNVFCKEEAVEFSITMGKAGAYINYIEKFNNKTIDVSIYVEDNRTFCERTDTDEYGVVTNKKRWFGCKTPSERWNELRKAYNF